MKVLRDGICYVDFEDLVFKPCKAMELDKEFYNEGEMVILKREEDVNYIMSRDDIINYDDVASLSSKRLNQVVLKAENKLNNYYERILNTPKADRHLLWKNPKFANGYKESTYKVETLRKYSMNKDEYDEKVLSYTTRVAVLKKEIPYARS
jgi:hypothetical protein